MMNKKLIGLTGAYCAGKNFAAQLLEKRFLPVLDLDKLGHKVIEIEKERLTLRFGDNILDPYGEVDRKLLGVKVFGKPKELAALEEIVHPAVNRETLAWINGRQEQTCVINAALLHRSSVFGDLDALIIVEAPIFIRFLRAKKRDHLPWLALIRRFGSQKDFSSQYLREKTDIYRVENSGFFSFGKHFSKMKLEKRIDEILSSQAITKV
jgi:dephospho-CoA kinase